MGKVDIVGAEPTEKLVQEAAKRAATAAMKNLATDGNKKHSMFSTALVYAWGLTAAVGVGLGTAAYMINHERTVIIEAKASDPVARDFLAKQQLALKNIDFNSDQKTNIDTVTTASVEQENTLADEAQAFPTEQSESETIVAAKSPNEGEALGVIIGDQTDIATLVKRYKNMRDTDPLLVGTIDPLVNFVDIEQSENVELIAGPFDLPIQAEAYCNKVRARLALDCQIGNYTGDRLLRD